MMMSKRGPALPESSNINHGSKPGKLKNSYISHSQPATMHQSQVLSNPIRKKQNSVKKLLPFLQSRETMGVSKGTLDFYRSKLGKFCKEIDPDKCSRQDIECFLLHFNSPGNRHCHFRAIKTFFNWREEVYGFPTPMKYMKAPRLPKLILPSLSREQVKVLIDHATSDRDKSIIALFTESGLRLSELTSIRSTDIDWREHTIKVFGKGGKEALAPFGNLSEKYLRLWLEGRVSNGSIWGLNRWGIESMLKRLGEQTGLSCNPHVFRRTFACLLRKAEVDTLIIKDLGRWESIEMVQRYTRSVTFHDCLKICRNIMGEQ